MALIRRIVFAFTLVAALSVPLIASPQKDLVVKFYELRERTLDQRGTAADVSNLLALLTPDAKYEHPTAGIVMSKTQARSGITAHLREGNDAKYTFRRARFAQDFAVVELTLEYTVDGKVVRRNGTSIFEFKGNRISRIAEY